MTDLTFEQYQKETASTAVYPEVGTGSAKALTYVTLGAVGEAGEIANKVKKILRDSGGVVSEEVAKDLLKEIGDLQWYVARLADELNGSLGDIAQGNLDKLSDRKARGVIQGSGDNR